MGCDGSKNVAVSDQSGKDGNQAAQGEAKGNEGQANGVQTEEGGKYITEEEAVTYVKTIVTVSDAQAKKIVSQVDRNDDHAISESGLKQLMDQCKDEKEKLKTRFQEFDKDNSGFVTQDEAVGVLTKVIPDFPSTHIPKLVSKFDRDNNGKLSYEEFSSFYTSVQVKKDEINAKYEGLASDDNGKVKPDALVGVLEDTYGMETDFAQSMVGLFDADKDGLIDKAEYKKFWSGMLGW